MTEYIYESPDNGKTVYRREFGSDKREKVTEEQIPADIINIRDFLKNNHINPPKK